MRMFFCAVFDNRRSQCGWNPGRVLVSSAVESPSFMSKESPCLNHTVTVQIPSAWFPDRKSLFRKSPFPSGRILLKSPFLPVAFPILKNPAVSLPFILPHLGLSHMRWLPLHQTCSEMFLRQKGQTVCLPLHMRGPQQ